MSERTVNVTPDTINNVVEFDAPFRVIDDSTIVIGVPNLYAPDLLDDDLMSDDWKFYSTGYTGQDSYSGPIMHNSEYLGGRLAADMLAEPGIYMMVVSNYSADRDEDCDRVEAGTMTTAQIREHMVEFHGLSDYRDNDVRPVPTGNEIAEHAEEVAKIDAEGWALLRYTGTV